MPSPTPTRPVPSPFLPGTTVQFAWDSTSIGLFKTCPRLYQYTMLEGWQAKGESVHLRFGIEYHQALQEYDVSRANGVNHEDSIHDVVSELWVRTRDWDFDKETKAGRYKNPDTLISLVIDYLDHFGENDPAETYIKADGAPAVELSFQFPLDWGPVATEQTVLERMDQLGAAGREKPGDPKPPIPLATQPYLLCGHLDRVVHLNGALLVMDRKTTTTTLGPYYFAQYEPHNQMTLYSLAGRVVLNAPIRGVCIDAAQVLLDSPNRFVRGFTYRTPDQLDEWLEDLAVLLRSAEAYATAGHWPMNDTACDKFGGCRFREICSKSPQVRPNFLRANFEQLEPDARWNPLKPR